MVRQPIGKRKKFRTHCRRWLNRRIPSGLHCVIGPAEYRHWTYTLLGLRSPKLDSVFFVAFLRFPATWRAPTHAGLSPPLLSAGPRPTPPPPTTGCGSGRSVAHARSSPLFSLAASWLLLAPWLLAPSVLGGTSIAPGSYLLATARRFPMPALPP